MRFKRLSRRFQIVGGCASLFMLGMYVDRLTLKHSWLEGFAVVCYLFTCLAYFLPLHRQYKRDDREFRTAMRQLENEMRGRF